MTPTELRALLRLTPCEHVSPKGDICKRPFGHQGNHATPIVGSTSAWINWSDDPPRILQNLPRICRMTPGPCYRYVTVSDGMVVSRHHKLTSAHRVVKANRKPLLAFYLVRPLPIRVGDAVPDNAQPRPLRE